MLPPSEPNGVCPTDARATQAHLGNARNARPLILATLKFDHSIKAKPKPYLAKRAKNAKEDSRKTGFGFLGVLGALGEKFRFVRKTRGLIRARAICQVSDRARVRGNGRCGTRTIFSW